MTAPARSHRRDAAPPAPAGAREAAWHRPARLPALGLPDTSERRRGGWLVSLVLHLAVIALVLMPAFALHTGVVIAKEQGAGGPGPAGGGGGGTRGTGGTVEHLQYVQVAPAPAPTVAVAPPVTPPVTPPITPPVKPPVQAPVETKPQPTVPPVDAAKPTTAPTTPAATAGSGGGTGADGTAGNGPGSGGGVGSGVGTGRGAGTGPGTGGGTQANYPPQPDVLIIPPTPVPSSVQGAHVLAEFDVDEHGRVLSFTFTPTRDRGYNRKLDDLFKALRFRPGTRPDGTPIRMKTQIAIDL